MVFDGYVDLKDKRVVRKALYVDIVTTKVLNNRMYLSTSGILGSVDKHMAFSAFSTLNEYFMVGVTGYSDVEFNLSGQLTLLGVFPYKDFLIQPFLVADDANKTRKLHSVGVKIYYKDFGAIRSAVIFPHKDLVPNKDIVYYTLGFSIPFKNLNFLEDLGFKMF